MSPWLYVYNSDRWDKTKYSGRKVVPPFPHCTLRQFLVKAIKSKCFTSRFPAISPHLRVSLPSITVAWRGELAGIWSMFRRTDNSEIRRESQWGQPVRWSGNEALHVNGGNGWFLILLLSLDTTQLMFGHFCTRLWPAPCRGVVPWECGSRKGKTPATYYKFSSCLFCFATGSFPACSGKQFILISLMLHTARETKQVTET